MSRDEFHRRKAACLCLHFGKQGHQSWECPVRKSQGDRQHSQQRHVTANKGKGKSKGKGKGKGKAKGKSGKGPIREIDVVEGEYYLDEEYDEHEEWEYDEYEAWVQENEVLKGDDDPQVNQA